MKYALRYLIIVIFVSSCTNRSADLLLTNGKIWTGDSNLPWASWVAVKDGKIIDVGTSDNLFDGMATETIELQQRLTLPGFNDSHVHFASAGHLLLNINLLDVNSSERFIENVRQTTGRLPEGSWITGGDWGAYEAWSMGSAGGKNRIEFKPHRDMIDSITAKYPVLVTRYDRKTGLANAAALEFLNIDSDDGILTGNLLDDALAKIPEKSFEHNHPNKGATIYSFPFYIYRPPAQ